MLIYRPLTSGALMAALVCGYTACEPKATEASVQAQVAAQLQTKAADDRVALLEQQVADMKTGKAKTAVTGDQEAINQISAAHIRSLDRQLADAKQRASERRKDAITLAATPADQRAKFSTVEVPTGTRLTVRMGSELATDRDQPGDPWVFHGDLLVDWKPLIQPMRAGVFESLVMHG